MRPAGFHAVPTGFHAVPKAGSLPPGARPVKTALGGFALRPGLFEQRMPGAVRLLHDGMFQLRLQRQAYCRQVFLAQLGAFRRFLFRQPGRLGLAGQFVDAVDLFFLQTLLLSVAAESAAECLCPVYHLFIFLQIFGPASVLLEKMMYNRQVSL